MTEKKKRFLSLSVKPLFVLLLGLVLLVMLRVLLLAALRGRNLMSAASRAA